MSAATMNEMERLRRELDDMAAERDALTSRVDFLNQQNSDQQEQNDELAAQVEWLDGLRRNVIEAIHDDRFEDLDISFYRDDQQPPKPTTSLARLKAEWQAEALESLCPRLVTKADQQITRHHARGLRRQSKDATNGHH